MPSDLREPGGAGRAEGAPGRPAPAVLGTQNKGRAFTEIKMEGKWEKLIAWLVAQHLVQRQLLMACWDAALEQWIFKSVASTGVRTDLPLGTLLPHLPRAEVPPDHELYCESRVISKLKPFSPCQKNLQIVLFP